ncbi:hypothetical protein [Poriferisphaera sp. WC338]|uniref:hypothetical protein n=1 Tax=Poriferisphaera sp. WC338 TaxID=3425129 RepID=UPI003D812B5B
MSKRLNTAVLAIAILMVIFSPLGLMYGQTLGPRAEQEMPAHRGAEMHIRVIDEQTGDEVDGVQVFLNQTAHDMLLGVRIDRRVWDDTPAKGPFGGPHLAVVKGVTNQRLEITDLPEGAVVVQMVPEMSRFVGEGMLTGVPSKLIGEQAVVLPRGDAMLPGQVYTFQVNQPVEVYLFVQEIGGFKLENSWKPTVKRATWTKGEQHFRDRMYRKSFETGQVEIPGHVGTMDVVAKLDVATRQSYRDAVMKYGQCVLISVESAQHDGVMNWLHESGVAFVIDDPTQHVRLTDLKDLQWGGGEEYREKLLAIDLSKHKIGQIITELDQVAEVDQQVVIRQIILSEKNGSDRAQQLQALLAALYGHRAVNGIFFGEIWSVLANRDQLAVLDLSWTETDSGKVWFDHIGDRWSGSAMLEVKSRRDGEPTGSLSWMPYGRYQYECLQDGVIVGKGTQLFQVDETEMVLKIEHSADVVE